MIVKKGQTIRHTDGNFRQKILSNRILRKIIDYIFFKNQRKFFNTIRTNNKNNDFSLITNNCIGGFIYKNLNIQYMSPTIWLTLSCDDYLEFVKHLKYYLSQKIVESETNENYPVGVIVPDDSNYKPITIRFNHYRTFNEAVEKWNYRAKRINYDNIFYIMDYYSKYDNEKVLYEFNNLHLKSAIISDKYYENIDNLYVADYNKSEHNNIFKNDGLSGKLFLDRWDYISFLN